MGLEIKLANLKGDELHSKSEQPTTQNPLNFTCNVAESWNYSIVPSQKQFQVLENLEYKQTRPRKDKGREKRKKNQKQLVQHHKENHQQDHN